MRQNFWCGSWTKCWLLAINPPGITSDQWIGVMCFITSGRSFKRQIGSFSAKKNNGCFSEIDIERKTSRKFGIFSRKISKRREFHQFCVKTISFLGWIVKIHQFNSQFYFWRHSYSEYDVIMLVRLRVGGRWRCFNRDFNTVKQDEELRLFLFSCNLANFSLRSTK